MKEAAIELCRIAAALQVVVVMDFNNVELFAQPSSTPEEVVSGFNHVMDVRSRIPAPRLAMHPDQPIVRDPDGVDRFKANAIVLALVDRLPGGMNQLARETYSDEDRRQLAQLIGYSVAGYHDLSYTRPERT